MKYIVTGGLGFIGSNIVRHLNSAGIHDITIVDRFTKEKQRNLLDAQISEFVDKDEFDPSRYAKTNSLITIFHMGAQSSTAQDNFDVVMRDNIESTKKLIDVAIGNPRIRLVYASSASVYGNGTEFNEKSVCNAESLYAWSKLTSDNYLATKSDARIVGLRFFNVYGPHESHKGTQSSPILRFFNYAIKNDDIPVFRPASGFSRDFVDVKDVVNVCNFFAKHRAAKLSGVFNVGTGYANSFGLLAKYTADAVAHLTGKKAVEIYEIESDVTRQRQYQKFTCADITKLRSAGYDNVFTDPGKGVYEYVKWLLENSK